MSRNIQKGRVLKFMCKLYCKNAQFCAKICTDMKKRLLFYKLKKYIHHKNALVITGMRQVGKTTLLKQIYDELGEGNKLWFDFDNPLDQKIFEDIEYKNIYQRLRNLANMAGRPEKLYVFIDEIQNFPEITKIIKFMIDYYGVKFFVTGSSGFYLKNLFPESLSGRKFLYILPPLGFQEILYFKEKISLEKALKLNEKINFSRQSLMELAGFAEDYREFLEFGGLPEVVITKDIGTKKEILRNSFSSFFEKDLRLPSDYKDIKELRDLIILLVPRVGSMLDISKLSNELGVERRKIYYYLEFLEGTFFLHLVSKFSHSVDKSVAGGKKVYFSDTGLLKMIGNVNDAQLLENAVINQFESKGEISFYNKRNSAEIDLILNKEIAFEIKTKASVSDVEKTKKLSKHLGLSKAFVISMNYVDHKSVISPFQL